MSPNFRLRRKTELGKRGVKRFPIFMEVNWYEGETKTDVMRNLIFCR